MVNEIIPNQMATDKKTQDLLKAAAKAWRLPYWDWAVNNNVPLLAQNEYIEVSTKLGTAKIKNPLYQYDLPKGKTFGTMGPASNQTYVLISADGVPASISNAKFDILLISWTVGTSGCYWKMPPDFQFGCYRFSSRHRQQRSSSRKHQEP
jgi:hypothetical protein